MSTTGLLPTFLCALIVFIPIVAGGIYATKAKYRYMSFTNKLRRDGKYTEWAKANKILLRLETFSLYAFLASFIGFIIVGFFKLDDIAVFLFVCFIAFFFMAVIVSLTLHLKVPKE
jgi:hypothetical protein